jgi:hypothetical protein
MGKVTISVQGYGDVVVERPRTNSKRAFSDAVASVVADTCQLVLTPPSREAFHPVLGKGGFDWDHENQRAVVREAPAPRVDVKLTGVQLVLVHLRQVWSVVQDYGRGLRGQFY